MQRWEYKIHVIQRTVTIANSTQWSPIDLDKLGAEGWELVSVTPVSSAFATGGVTTEIGYHFKRPIG